MKLLCLIGLLFSSLTFAADKLVIPGVKGPNFDLQNGRLIVTFKLPKVEWNIGGEVNIPKTKNSFLNISDNLEESGTLITLKLDVNDLKGVELSQNPGVKLPDGRDLPGVQGGILKDSIRADLDKRYHNLSFYYHQKLFGISIPLSWNVGTASAYTKVLINKKSAGQLGLVGNPNPASPAYAVLFLRLDVLKDPEFQALLQQSQKNPEMSFKPKGE